MQTNWTGSAAVKLKIIARPGPFTVLVPVFAVGLLGGTVPVVGNAALMETVVCTGNTNLVIGLERAVVFESTAASGSAGELTVTP